MKIAVLILYLAGGGSFAHPERYLATTCEEWARTINVAIDQGVQVVDDDHNLIVHAECRPASEVRT